LVLSANEALTFAGVALFSAFCFNWPFLRRLSVARPQELLEGVAITGVSSSWRNALMDQAPLFVLFMAMAAWLAGSWLGAFRVAGSLSALALLGWLAGRLLFKGFFRVVRNRPGLLRLVAVGLARGRPGTNLGLLALLVISLAINLVPHLLNSLVSEVEPLTGKEVPAFFLFNIPESGIDELRKFAGESRAELRFVSPLVLGRVLRVNDGAPVSDQLTRFPVRLTYREGRIPSEVLVSGRDLPGIYDPAAGRPVEVSIEEEFAERNSLALGDSISIDVQGLVIDAKVTSLRKVKWTSFNPNFFIVVQPGVLEEAPKTWVANVGLEGPADEKVAIQYEISRRFPDISMVDIGRTVERVLETARQVLSPVRASAWFAVITAFLILLGLVTHNLRLRKPEIEVNKLLGADASLIRRIFISEYALIGFFAWIVGAGGALFAAAIVSTFVLEIQFRPSYETILASLLALPPAAGWIAWRASDRLLREGSAALE
jgi:putative ABC transport system permease protein